MQRAPVEVMKNSKMMPYLIPLSALLLAVSLSESVGCQLPPDARPLNEGEIARLGQAIVVAKQVAGLMPGINGEIARAGIANLEKIMPDPANPDAPPRLGVNTDPLLDPKGTGAGTLPESIQGGKCTYTSGVGVGEECTLFGGECISQPLIMLGDVCVHEGLRLKEQGQDDLPPPGGAPWEPPLEQRRRKWLRDWYVHSIDREYYEAYVAFLLANPPVGEKLLKFCRLYAEWHADVTNDNARRYNRS